MDRSSPGHIWPTWDILKAQQKPLLWFCLWFVFPDNSAAFGWTSQCVCQVNLISLVCKLSKKIERKINPFHICRLESELLSVASVFTNFLECVQMLRDSAVNTQSNGENNERRGCNDVNSATEGLCHHIDKYYDKFCPIKQIKVHSNYLFKPTPELLASLYQGNWAILVPTRPHGDCVGTAWCLGGD